MATRYSITPRSYFEDWVPTSVPATIDSNRGKLEVRRQKNPQERRVESDQATDALPTIRNS